MKLLGSGFNALHLCYDNFLGDPHEIS